MNVIITGGSRGIGKSIAEIFAGDKQGHTVLLCAKTKEPLELTGRELQGRFPRANVRTFTCDLSKKEQVGLFAEWIMKETNKIDVLINNAGSFAGGSVHSEEDGALEQMIETNLYSAYHLTRKLLPVMMKQKSGHIFNMSSIAGLKAYPNGGSYSISKFALRGLSMNLREELKEYNIKVTTVFPGAAYTDSWIGQVKKERVMEANDIAMMVYSAAHLSPQACVEELIIRPQLGDL
jgi:short-subunit dehydrogenase